MVKSHKRIFLVALTMMALAALSACHGSGGGTYAVRWVNEADNKKVLELTLQDPGVLGRMHLAVMGGRVRGSYLLKDGDKTSEGRVTQLEDVYRLVAPDGKEQKFSVDRTSGALKDESGATWKEDNPATKVTLKELRSTVEQRQP